MTRDEAIDLLQVMLLDEREPPGLAPKGFVVRADQPGRQPNLVNNEHAVSATQPARPSGEADLKNASIPVSLAWPSLRL